MVTFIELGPDGPGSDDEPLARGTRRPVPDWLAGLRKSRYLALLVGLIGGLLAGDAAGTPAVLASAGLVYADRGHCPITVDCAVVGRPRQDFWDSYNRLFEGTTPVGGNLWYASDTGTVYYQELDVTTKGSDITITLKQQRISGPPVSFGATVDRPPRRTRALVTARRGPWLLTAALFSPGGARLPITAAMQWVESAPLPG